MNNRILAILAALAIAACGGGAPESLYGASGQRDFGHSVFAVFDNGRKFLVNAFVPDTAPNTWDKAARAPFAHDRRASNVSIAPTRSRPRW